MCNVTLHYIQLSFLLDFINNASIDYTASNDCELYIVNNAEGYSSLNIIGIIM
jgi:hypothetical protein